MNNNRLIVFTIFIVLVLVIIKYMKNRKQENFYSVHGIYYNNPYYRKPLWYPHFHDTDLYNYVYSHGHHHGYPYPYNAMQAPFGLGHTHNGDHHHILMQPKIVNTSENKIYYKTYPIYKRLPSWYWDSVLRGKQALTNGK